MEFIKTEIDGVIIIKPHIYKDERGYFFESYNKRDFEKQGIFYNFVQDNYSFSKRKGTIRGLHFQKGEYSQAKLVKCLKGAVNDVAVDLRKGSPTYKKWVKVTLSEENNYQLLIPRGFAHGFETLTENVKFAYKADNYYNKNSEGSILWNDSTLSVKWETENPILSPKDRNAQPFDDLKFEYFTYLGV